MCYCQYWSTIEYQFDNGLFSVQKNWVEFIPLTIYITRNKHIGLYLIVSAEGKKDKKEEGPEMETADTVQVK